VEIKEIILNFPKQLAEGIISAKNVKTNGKFESAVVCAMGGSAWPAEILRDWLSPGFPFYVNKTYNLQSQINKKSLVIICSYSGNTEEALSCYREAKKRGFKIVGLTTGGELKKLCHKDKIPLALMPNDVSVPRLGCGYTIGALAKILSNNGLISEKTKEITTAAARINPLSLEKEGERLAKQMVDRIPVIYTTDHLKTLSYIWKIKFNETSKVPAFSNYFPELNHNELSAYAKNNDKFAVIILRDKNDSPKILKRMSLTAEMIKASGAKVEFADLSGKTDLEKILNSILLADWTSYSLAIENKVDPFSIKLQEEIKKQLNNK
jgi:glucose/mannose-6-phosphate isomerase